MRRGIMMHPGAQVVKEATLQHCNVASCNRTYREISKAAASKSVCKPVATPKVSKGRSESPLVASAEAKPCETEKARMHLSLATHKKSISCRKPYPHQEVGPEGFQRASGKPFGRLRRGEILRNRKEQGTPFPLPSTRNLFLVRGFARLRADEVLSPRGKVPKGRRGRPKGACGVAAPGPPVAK